MRLLLLTHYYPPETGAPQRRWDRLVRGMRAEGHVVTVVTAVPHYPQGRAAPGAPRGRGLGTHGEAVVRVPYLPYDSGRGRRLVDQLVVAAGSLRAGLRARPDVVVATVPGLPTLWLGRALARWLGVPLVVEMRDAWPDLLIDAGSGPRWLRHALSSATTRAQRRADALVCVSGHFADRLRARGMRRVVHVPNGVDLETVPAVGRTSSPRAPGEPLRVLYAGTVGESQAVHVAVAALALLPAGTVHITVVGHGAGLTVLRRVVRSLPDPDDVLLMVPVPPGEVASLVARTDTALVCLRDWPSFAATVPSKLYELMAMGVHVTGVLSGEAASIVRDAGAGDVVAPGDVAALARLWSGMAADPTRTVVGGAPRRWVASNADVGMLSARYLALLDEVGPSAGAGT